VEAMRLTEAKNILENTFSSYETKIESIEAIFDTVYQILQGFQDTLDVKKEREKVTAELRESLAEKESLRRKDFDNMMQGILTTQDKREREVRNLVNGYLNDQKEVTRVLRENLRKFKDSLTKGETERIKEFRALTNEILAKEEERKKGVVSMLKEFQKEQQKMMEELKTLLAKGKELRIKDLKLMLKQFKNQHKERVARQQERREYVRGMLDGFKKQRMEAIQNR